ncbi:unnamed protein product [Mytilus edulis]|uniref:Endonuclease/exonuclease/phosphatase domain-containing protein n=1 Tax=Mytilus edulis TaxID=6550 RepID=A0A8S3TUS2_MYTED|nr:unnamed protein product [Mytilus edulis]
MGDFNARTAELEDCIKHDSSDLNKYRDTNILPENYNIDTCLDRNNQDLARNTYGNNLIDLCISSRLRILNGRYIGDSQGYYTCITPNGYSSVDYAVTSVALLSSVQYFKTCPFNYLSDHAQIEVHLKCNIKLKQTNNFDSWKTTRRFLWEENSKQKLIEVLASNEIKENIINFEL